MRTGRLGLVGIVGTVVGVQVSTASMWWTPAAGVPLLIVDALLAASLLAGAAHGRSTGCGRIAALIAVLSGAACVWFATLSESAECGSPLVTNDYDCVPIDGTLGVVVTAAVTMGAGGSAMVAWRGGRRFGLRRTMAFGVIGAAVALVGAALVVVPRTVPSAPSPAAALAEVTREVRLAATLLALAIVLVSAVAAAWSDQRHELPLRSTLIGAWCAVIASAVVWFAVLADYVKGP